MSGALTADLVMGLTGSGKSCLAATYATYVWKRHKKVTLYYAIDPGGVPSIVRKYMELGIIRLWRVRTRDPDERLDMAQGTLKKAVQGYWPAEFRSVKTGEVGPGVQLVPAITTKMSLLCPSGHVVKTGTTDSQLNGAFLCPECGVNSSRQNGQIKVENFVTPGFEDVGGRVYDGLTSACEWVMSDLRRRGANIDQGALKSPLKLVSDGMVFGANSETHYGFAQNLAEDLLKSTAQIPDLVAPPIWTANEKQAEDKSTRQTLVGPEISGSARTLAVPRWVGNLFGAISLDIDTEGGTKKEWRLYLRQYKSPLDGLPRACKTRFSPSKGITFPEFLSDGPTADDGLPENGEEPFTQFSLARFYMLEEAALEAQLKQEVAGYKDVPKTPESYGADLAKLDTMQAKSVKVDGPKPVAPAGRTGKRRQRKPPTPMTPPKATVATPPVTTATPAPAPPDVGLEAPQPPGLEAPQPPGHGAPKGIVPPAGARPGATIPSPKPSAPKPPTAAVARPRRRKKR